MTTSLNNHIFRGRRLQRGHGLGNILSRFFRRTMPLLKSAGKYIAKNLTKTGIHTIQDIAAGTDANKAFKRQLANSSDVMLNDVRNSIRKRLVGNGIKKRRRKNSKKRRSKSTKKRKSNNKPKIVKRKKNVKKVKKRTTKYRKKNKNLLNDIFL